MLQTSSFISWTQHIVHSGLGQAHPPQKESHMVPPELLLATDELELAAPPFPAVPPPLAMPPPLPDTELAPA